MSDRHTRDRVRLFFWAVLVVVCLAAVAVSRQQQTQGLQRKADAARERAVRFTQNVLVDQLDAERVSHPIGRSGYDQLLADLNHGLLIDQRVVRVRVWRADGLLVFTTDHRSEIGVTTSDDTQLRSALRGDLVSVVVNESFAPDDATTPEPTALLSTWIPLRASDKADVFGAVQIDNDYSVMVDATSHPWKQMQLAFAIVAVLCLAMAVVSFVWSRRTEEVAAPPLPGRDAWAGTRDEKKTTAARDEAAKLRARVEELEATRASVAERQEELEKARARAEEQSRGAESRISQLQSRVTELEAQLRLTTDQLRAAQQRAEDARTVPEVPAPIQAQLDAAAETERLLRAELETARSETQRAEREREAIERAHSEEARSQQGQLDEVRAQARLAEEERQRILAEATKSPQPEISEDGEARIRELTQQLERSEAERAMLRAGRPETVYEARNRQLEDELAQIRGELAVGRGRSGDAATTGVDPGAIAAMEERIAAAEERARDAERRLDEAKPRRVRPRAGRRANAVADRQEADTPAEPNEGEAPAEPEAELAAPDGSPETPGVDGSELRSRLVKSTDARRRGISTPTAVPTPGPRRR